MNGALNEESVTFNLGKGKFILLVRNLKFYYNNVQRVSEYFELIWENKESMLAVKINEIW